MRTFIAVFVLLGVTPLCAAEPAVRIVADAEDPTRVTVDMPLHDGTPVAASANRVEESFGRRYLTFALVDEMNGTAGPAIFGRYERVDSRLRFRPEFGLVRGATYRAVARDPEQERDVGTAEYRVPSASATQPTVVSSLTPGGELPANVLRFYVTFSRPMREGREVLERIKLLDEAGTEIASPWRDIELWNDDATRLTLFLHPGRIKRGVNLREELGPLLQPNRRYAIVIGGDLRDAAGNQLGREFRHAFSTTAELNQRIDVAAWIVSAPAAGTREPQRVTLDRPLDAALALRLIRIREPAGNAVVGKAELDAAGRMWTFTPAALWQAVEYVVEADPTLEDLAGNSPVRVFDNDLTEPTVEIGAEQLRRPFTPR